jgi:hypothetical protein
MLTMSEQDAELDFLVDISDFVDKLVAGYRQGLADDLSVTDIARLLITETDDILDDCDDPADRRHLIFHTIRVAAIAIQRLTGGGLQTQVDAEESTKDWLTLEVLEARWRNEADAEIQEDGADGSDDRNRWRWADPGFLADADDELDGLLGNTASRGWLAGSRGPPWISPMTSTSSSKHSSGKPTKNCRDG